MFAFFKKFSGKKRVPADLDAEAKKEALPGVLPEVPEAVVPADAGDAAAAPDEGPQAPRSWIGVDLDGTLAHYSVWRGLGHVGRPVPVMLARVKHWLEEGYTIKIFTARAGAGEAGIVPVKKWLAANGLPDLEVTNQKDFAMIELWDDRAVQVVANTGRPFLSPSVFGRPAAPILPDENAGDTFYLLKNRVPAKTASAGQASATSAVPAQEENASASPQKT